MDDIRRVDAVQDHVHDTDVLDGVVLVVDLLLIGRELGFEPHWNSFGNSHRPPIQ